MPRILVLLATYNGLPWLREQLDSILLQEGVAVQVLICDDASSDGTLQLISDGWHDDPRVKFHALAQGSGSAGANFRQLYIQADLNGFDFVALADQDDVWLPRKLVEAVDASHQTNAQGYSCAVHAFWSDGREDVLNQDSRIRAADFLFEGAGQGCTFVIRADFFVRIQQFCRRYRAEVETLHYHDWLIYLLARAWELTWHFDARPWMRYRQHGGNEIGARGNVTAIKRRLEMIRNGWYLQQVQAAIRLYGLAGGSNRAVARISKALNATGPFAVLVRRLQFANLLLRYGRRRFADRLVLAVAALFGFL